MNKTQRAKIQALRRHVRLSRAAGDHRFLASMIWLRDNEPGTVLQPKQAWLLDVVVYKYRRQLGGLDLEFDIPAQPPQLVDYGGEPKAGPKQANIFGGEDQPRRTRLHADRRGPQRDLF